MPDHPPAEGARQHDEARRRPGFVEFARTRDPELRDALVTEHLPLANQLARRFAYRGEPHDDLVQVASVALIHAVDRFDPDRGVEFVTFATRTILGELKRHFRDHGWAVRAPRRIQELYLEVGHAVDTLTQELGRSPTIGELAVATGSTEEDVLESLEASRGYRASSIDAADREDGRLAVQLGTLDAALTGVEERSVVSPALERLTGRERRILSLRFEDGLSQSEIAAVVGVSQMHVSRLLRRSLAVLRSGLPDHATTDV